VPYDTPFLFINDLQGFYFLFPVTMAAQVCDGVILNGFIHCFEVMLEVIAPEFIYCLSDALAYGHPEASLNESIKRIFFDPA
jgi:hypothetical protein